MEHNPFLTLNDKSEITYSDIKFDENNNKYVTVYYESPHDDGFHDAEFNYPGTIINNTYGCTNKEMSMLYDNMEKFGKLSLDFAMEDFYANNNKSI